MRVAGHELAALVGHGHVNVVDVGVVAPLAVCGGLAGLAQLEVVRAHLVERHLGEADGLGGAVLDLAGRGGGDGVVVTLRKAGAVEGDGAVVNGCLRGAIVAEKLEREALRGVLARDEFHGRRGERSLVTDGGRIRVGDGHIGRRTRGILTRGVGVGSQHVGGAAVGRRP